MDTPVLRAKDILPTWLLRGQVPVSAERLRELERKERAHDSYLEATQHMRNRIVALPEWGKAWRDGYRTCLREFSEAVIDAGRER